MTALLLQLFFWMFGAGYFYLGVIDLALGELFLFWGGMIFMFLLTLVIVIFQNRNNPNVYDEPNDKIASFIGELLTNLIVIGSVIWWICSMVAIKNGTQLDGNGAATFADF